MNTIKTSKYSRLFPRRSLDPSIRDLWINNQFKLLQEKIEISDFKKIISNHINTPLKIKFKIKSIKKGAHRGNRCIVETGSGDRVIDRYCR